MMLLSRRIPRTFGGASLARRATTRCHATAPPAPPSAAVLEK
jgi:hypothetical protein